MELIDHFLSILEENDPSKEEVDRETLKRIVDVVGFVNVEDGVKFVCLSGELTAESVMRTDAESNDHVESNGNGNLQDNDCDNGNADNREQTGAGYRILCLSLTFSFVHEVLIYNLSFDNCGI